MKQLRCADLGQGCDYMASGDTREEVKIKLLAHANHAHPEMLILATGVERQAMTHMIDVMVRTM